MLAYIFALWSILTSKETDEGVEYLYEPHPAQLATIFLLLGIPGGSLANRLAQVLTGEGKSVILAGLSCYLALIGYEVHCVCYSSLLSERDALNFKELFSELNIIDRVYYMTLSDTMGKIGNFKARASKIRDIL